MKRLIIYALLASAPAAATAQETLTLQQCRERAIENNRQMAIARVTARKTESDVRTYKANFLPKISAQGGYLVAPDKMSADIEGGYLPTFVPGADGTLQPNIAGTDAAGNPIFKEYAYFPGLDMTFDLNNTFSAGVRLEQPIYMGGKISAAYRMAKVGREIAEQNTTLTRAQVVAEADKAYWNCVCANEMLIAANKMKEVIDELRRNVADAYELGLRMQTDVLKVNVKFNEADLMVRRATNAVSLSRMNLCHVIGLPLDADIRVAETFSTDSIASAVADQSIDISARPEYGILEKQVELKEYEKKLAQSDFRPEVGLMASYNYTNGVKMNNEKLFDEASFAAMISVSIPMFHWGEGSHKQRSAAAEQNIMKLRRLDLNEQMTLEATQALNQLDEALLEARMTARSLAEAEENMRISKDNHDVGMETLANYLEAQTMWQKAYAEWISAMARLRNSETEFLRTTGRLQ